MVPLPAVESPYDRLVSTGNEQIEKSGMKRQQNINETSASKGKGKGVLKYAGLTNTVDAAALQVCMLLVLSTSHGHDYMLLRTAGSLDEEFGVGSSETTSEYTDDASGSRIHEWSPSRRSIGTCLCVVTIKRLQQCNLELGTTENMHTEKQTKSQKTS